MNFNEELTYETFKVNNLGHLEIGGIDTTYLAQKYETPLIVYDIKTIKKNINHFKEALKVYEGQSVISYASKAFSSVALFQLLKKEDISIDVVSGGELYLANQADFPSEKISFHGNNKSIQELEEALMSNIGHIIVDNFYELELLDELTNKHNKTIDILLRLTPGIDVDTHKYIITGNTDSKFGFDLQSGQAKKAILQSIDHKYINLKGLHMHIGSQIFGTESYLVAINEILKNVKVWEKEFNFEMEVFNIGGGFGIHHVVENEFSPPQKQLQIIIKELINLLKSYNLSTPELWIEPGRSIIGSAGLTLYELGSQKNVKDVRHYVSIDGGMADNIRPALYDAKYSAALANRMNDEIVKEFSVAGKACETGDMLINSVNLPEVRSGDLLAVFNTGDYTFSMANNYNRLVRPAVVFVEDGKEFLAIRRETPEDFMRFENYLPEDYI